MSYYALRHRSWLRDLHGRAGMQGLRYTRSPRRLQVRTRRRSVNIHEFLAQNGFKSPEGPDSPFQYAKNIDLHMFPRLMQHPAKLTNFLNMLEGWRGEKVFWYDFFSVEEVIFKGARAGQDSTLSVDVAGGHG